MHSPPVQRIKVQEQGSKAKAWPSTPQQYLNIVDFIESVSDNGDGTVTIKTKAPYGPAH